MLEQEEITYRCDQEYRIHEIIFVQQKQYINDNFHNFQRIACHCLRGICSLPMCHHARLVPNEDHALATKQKKKRVRVRLNDRDTNTNFHFTLSALEPITAGQFLNDDTTPRTEKENK